MKWVKDRGLDHAVEKEKSLKPVIALKNLLKIEPGGSMPVSSVAELKDKLGLPTRAFNFIAYYPNVFETHFFSHTPRPYVKLTPEVLRIDSEENQASESLRHDIADRLLKLLMLTRHKRLPLTLIDQLKWDLGLPNDYVRSILPDFPDYFQIIPNPEPNPSPNSAFKPLWSDPFEKPNPKLNSTSPNPNSSLNSLWLDLVCWSDELAVSVMEKKAMKEGKEYKKGMALAFPLSFSRGYDIKKEVVKWVENLQKLPYISPYEDASYLDSRSDQYEKWMLGVLHELFHLFVAKKAEKQNVQSLGEHLGFRPRFTRAFAHHPGIFYASNKIKTCTVILREAYKRDLLVEKHPLMGFRYQYIHLMHKKREVTKESLETSKLVQDSEEKVNCEDGSGKITEEEEGSDDITEEEDGSDDFTEEEEEECSDSDSMEDEEKNRISFNGGLAHNETRTSEKGKAKTTKRASFGKRLEVGRPPPTDKGASNKRSRRTGAPKGSAQRSNNARRHVRSSDGKVTTF
ncbi:hypothetical protein AMTR_s00032p00206100 [Amborella trichopoda]|uniref:PORR domain-containing protein n=2 Tax=Amborella trichopoda TaxID=13333 RepID=U5CY97_AMBTC|nr:hypothetical protein AMTR_s00032p00206100 [Amborella trichopoda]